MAETVSAPVNAEAPMLSLVALCDLLDARGPGIAQFGEAGLAYRLEEQMHYTILLRASHDALLEACKLSHSFVTEAWNSKSARSAVESATRIAIAQAEAVES